MNQCESERKSNEKSTNKINTHYSSNSHIADAIEELHQNVSGQHRRLDNELNGLMDRSKAQQAHLHKVKAAIDRLKEDSLNDVAKLQRSIVEADEPKRPSSISELNRSTSRGK